MIELRPKKQFGLESWKERVETSLDVIDDVIGDVIVGVNVVHDNLRRTIFSFIFKNLSSLDKKHESFEICDYVVLICFLR